MHFKDVVKNPSSIMCYIDKDNLADFSRRKHIKYFSCILSASVTWSSVLLNRRASHEACTASVLLRHWI